MTRILFKFIIYPSCERALKNMRVKLKIFRKMSLNFTFGLGSCLISEFARPNSNKAVLLQIFPRFEIVIFNNKFAFYVAEFLEPVMSYFCSMPFKRASMFYLVFLKKYLKRLGKHL